MILVALDTATPATVAGVLLADGRVVEARDDPEEGSRGEHAARVLVLLDRAMGEAGVGWHDVERIGVGVGPGGFTGLGAVVPFGEVVFVPALPARVDSVAAQLGGPSDGSANPGGSAALVVLASPTLRADVSIPQAAGAFVHEGTPVELLYEATGETVAGLVSSIGAELVTSAMSGLPAYPAVVDAELPAQWSGLNVRATFTAASSGRPVLVVPSAAVSSSANGVLRVQVLREDGTVDIVEVTTGLSADGFIEVSPSVPGALADADRVVIG